MKKERKRQHAAKENAAAIVDRTGESTCPGVVDAVLDADAMAEAIAALTERVIADTRSDPAESPEFDANLRAILDILRTKVGHDFRCYKPTTLVGGSAGG